MKPFRFTLEAVATTRRRREQAALEQYAQALLARQRALSRLESSQRELEATWTELRRRLETGSAAAKVAQLRGLSRALEEEREANEHAHAETDRKVNQALQQMLAARREREAVDKFRARQFLAHDRDIQRETQKFLDELATQRPAPSLAWRATADSTP